MRFWWIALSTSILLTAVLGEEVAGPVVSLNDVSISGQVGPANSNGTAMPEVHEPTIGSIVKDAATSVAREVDKSLIKVRQTQAWHHASAEYQWIRQIERLPHLQLLPFYLSCRNLVVEMRRMRKKGKILLLL